MAFGHVLLLASAFLYIHAAPQRHAFTPREVRAFRQVVDTSQPVKISSAVPVGRFSDEIDSKHRQLPLSRFGVSFGGDSHPQPARNILTSPSHSSFETSLGRGAINSGPIISSAPSHVPSGLARGVQFENIRTHNIVHSQSVSPTTSFSFGQNLNENNSHNKLIPPKTLTYGFKPIFTPKNNLHSISSFSKQNNFNSIRHNQVNELDTSNFRGNNPLTFREGKADQSFVLTNSIPFGKSSESSENLFRHHVNKPLISSQGAGPGTTAIGKLLETTGNQSLISTRSINENHGQNTVRDASLFVRTSGLSEEKKQNPILSPKQTQSRREKLLEILKETIVSGSRKDSPSKSAQQSVKQTTTLGIREDPSIKLPKQSIQQTISSDSQGPTVIRQLPFRVIMNAEVSKHLSRPAVIHKNSRSKETVSNVQTRVSPKSDNKKNVRTSSSHRDSSKLSQNSSFKHVKLPPVSISPKIRSNKPQVSKKAPLVPRPVHFTRHSAQPKQNPKKKILNSTIKINKSKNTNTASNQSKKFSLKPKRISSVQTKTRNKPSIGSSIINSQSNRASVTRTHFPVRLPSPTQQTAKRPVTVSAAAQRPRVSNIASRNPRPIVKQKSTVSKAGRRVKVSPNAPKVVSASSNPSSGLPAAAIQALGGFGGGQGLAGFGGGSQVIVKTIVLDADDADPNSESFKKALEKARNEARDELGLTSSEELGVADPSIAKLFGKRRRRRQIFGGEDQTNAQMLSNGLSTGAGLLDDAEQ